MFVSLSLRPSVCLLLYQYMSRYIDTWFTYTYTHKHTYIYMMTSSNGSIFRVTGHLCWEFIGPRHKGQWRGALMFSLICFWINGWINNREAGDLRRYRAHYDVTVMIFILPNSTQDQELTNFITFGYIFFKRAAVIWQEWEGTRMITIATRGRFNITYKTSYRKISLNLGGTISVFRVFLLLWNLTDVSTMLLSNSLPN